MALEDIISSQGARQHFQFDVDDTGVQVASESEDRKTIVMINLGPDTAWGNTTLATATPGEGTPFYPGAWIVDGDSFNSWFFSTSPGESADIRGWVVE